MKRIFLFHVLVFFAFGLQLSGATVTVQDAQGVALNFFNLTTGNNQVRQPLTATLQYTRTETDNTVDFYVFAISPVTGFVIVSANDNDDPIIGYSTESVFRNDFSKVGLNDWLNRWSEELHYVAVNNVIASSQAAARWAAYRAGYAPAVLKTGGVTPFCQTTWDQNTEYQSGPNLYNNYCPGGSGSNQAVTGCVATAMAQIMRYWNYPPKGIGSNSYQDETSQGYQENYGTLTANFADSTFDWADMPLTLTNTSSTTQIDAIGRLMSCAGISVDMDYSPDGSGAQVLTAESGGYPCAQTAYVQNFGYQSIIQGLLLSGTGVSGGISSAAFTDSIEADLARGRLVQVQGTDQNYGGHTWVCDGYETSPSTMFHMNWGWSGYADGYFALTNMDPNDGDQLNFTEDIGALIHILPPAPSLTETASVNATILCPGGSTTLTAKTHTNATYSWAPTTGLACPTCAVTNVTATATTLYTVTADSAGVTATASITVSVDPAIIPGTGSVTAVTCNGLSTGSATITATGGSSGFTYRWSNNQTTATISNLPAGTYYVTITDSKSCTASTSLIVTQPAVLTGSVTPGTTTCGLANGSASVTASGGTSTYTYHWSSGQTVYDINNVAAGNYTVTITDAHNCTTEASATIATSTGITASVTSVVNVLCYGGSTGSLTATASGGTGLTYAWSNNGGSAATAGNLAAGLYTVTVTSGAGCTSTASQTITQPSSAVAVSLTPVDASCNQANGSVTASGSGGTSGYTYLWNTNATTPTISGLNAGTYTVTVKDANSCSTNASVTLTSSAVLNTSATTTNVSCNGGSNGSISVSVTGSSGNLSYSWNIGGQSSATLSNVPAGTYSVTVSNGSGCTASLTASLTQPAPVNVTTTSTNATGNQDNGSASVTNVSGGTGNYSYEWSNGDTTQSITNVAPGDYKVSVTDQNGCQSTASVIVGTTTGINDVAASLAFSVYPNPAVTDVVVSISKFTAGATISIRNILGQQLYIKPVTDAQTHIDISTFANGVYLVELQQGEKAAIHQLVVNK